jgi:hypothetical protein
VDHQDLLLTFAEVAVAFAGFSAVVSAFDRRREDDDPRMRHYRVRVMVEYSVCVTVFAFVPALLNALLDDEQWAWRIASAGLLIVWSTIGLQASVRAHQILDKSPFEVARAFSWASTGMGWGGGALLFFNTIGYPVSSEGDTYLVALFLPLLQSALYFLRVVAHGDPHRRQDGDQG